MNQLIINKSASINISNIFKEAWQRIYGLKTSIFIVGFVYALILFMLRGPQLKQQSVTLNLAVSGLQMIINFFILAVLLTLTYQQAIGSKPSIKLAFTKCFKSILPIFGLGFVCSITVTLVTFICAFGFMLLQAHLNVMLTVIAIIPVALLYFYIGMIAVIFALPLILFKNQSITSAIALSFQATNRYYLKLLLTQIACWILIFVGMLPAGIGYIWAIPLVWMVNLIWFREVFGF